ncbi:MAG: murein biosynthesis integral membrane protein MurJ [Candidatus Omnitrophica bacterium]|nr:murein biosynthesis integral membrane protein MurJ [Candidatus Omnitrophota bacterium]MDD5351748.1 murein biosynthesis integral membrane protein MurJ [Candidatus Omnitrophota bacterium]MDD5550959.1 murein biosynthesis integral membrane protein MurJ [Candidatus Omnitrophota bacterium]
MSKKSLVKSASIISGATLLSRVLGFVRDVVMARTFGTGWIAQAFFVAFRIPNMFRELAAEGASNAAFVPVFSEYLATKERREFWKLINTVFVAFVIIVSSIVVIGMVLSPLLVRLIAPGFIQMPEKLNLTISINRPLFGYLMLVCIATFIMGVLYTFKSFFAPSFSPVIFNVVLIVSIIFADNSVSGIWKVVAGVLVAGIFQIVIQLPAIFKQGFKIRPFEFQKDIFGHPGVRLIGRLLVPRIIGTAVYQLNILVDTIFASLSFLVGPGAIAAIYYSSRLIQFPLGVFGHSISNASLPTLSEFAARKELDKFAETVEFSLTNILFIMIPASLGLIILSHPIIKLMFERGQFNSYSTMITSVALAFYAVGLFAYGANKFLALCFNALQDTITPVKVSGLALLINIVLNALFVVVLKTKIAGLAFASSISAIIATLVLYNFLHRRIQKINSQWIMVQTIKMLLASIFMSLVIFFVWQKLEQSCNPIVGLAITVCLSVIVYIFATFYLKVYQATNLFKWILRKA